MLLVRIRWAGLYPICSLLSCSWTGLLLLSRTLQYLISSLLHSSSGQFSQPKLALCWPDMKHSVQWYTSLFVRLSLKRVFHCCVNSLYLAIVTETFLYVLSRNRCLCHNLRDISTSCYLAMDFNVIICSDFHNFCFLKNYSCACGLKPWSSFLLRKK
jgi:hypothetical protein